MGGDRHGEDDRGIFPDAMPHLGSSLNRFGP